MKLRLLFILIVGISFGCKQKTVVSHHGAKDLISFKSVENINYVEVSRRTGEGLSFNKYGYYLKPQWELRFVSDDSVSIYSPIKKTFLNFPLTRGYDSIFNAARAWLKVRKMTKDSLVFEMLKLQGDSIEVNGTKVYMTFYSDDFIKENLHSDASVLQKPSRHDSLFIKSLAEMANADFKKAFAATEPATFESLKSSITIKKMRNEPDMLNNNFDISDDYMDPTYDVELKNTYKNFYYSFSVFIDNDGQMHYRMPLIDFRVADGFEQTYIRLSTGIMNGYLKYYIKVKPGNTLGFPHASIVSLHVRGMMSDKE